jgi:hypothetical protein
VPLLVPSGRVGRPSGRARISSGAIDRAEELLSDAHPLARVGLSRLEQQIRTLTSGWQLIRARVYDEADERLTGLLADPDPGSREPPPKSSGPRFATYPLELYVGRALAAARTADPSRDAALDLAAGIYLRREGSGRPVRMLHIEPSLLHVFTEALLRAATGEHLPNWVKALELLHKRPQDERWALREAQLPRLEPPVSARVLQLALQGQVNDELANAAREVGWPDNAVLVIELKLLSRLKHERERDLLAVAYAID